MIIAIDSVIAYQLKDSKPIECEASKSLNLTRNAVKGLCFFPGFILDQINQNARSQEILLYERNYKEFASFLTITVRSYF